MKKKLNLIKLLLLFSLTLPLSGCTSLDYVDDDVQVDQVKRIQTKEDFNLQVVEKSIGNVNIKAGISETALESALVLYMSVQNNSDTSYKFAMDDVVVSSPIGEVSKIPANMYIDGYYNYETANYVNMANAGAMLGNFATLQANRYQAYSSSANQLDASNSNSETASIEKTISGIQKHAISSYKYIEPNQTEYFYIFIRKPDEYPIVVNYKTLTYKFGGKKNAQE